MSIHTGGLVMLTEMIPNLPPSEVKLAKFILENPRESITLTASELGKRSNTSGAAVIRLCKSLGLSGFQELKLRIAGDLTKQKAIEYRDINPNETPSSIIEKMTDNNIQTIKETASVLRIEDLSKAVDAIINAGKIIFFGVGSSGIVAIDAQQKFLRINKVANAFSDVHMAATLVANASPNDVVIGISFSGQTLEVANILKLANEHGVQTISITKYGSSKVAEEAKIPLYTSATREATFRSAATSSRIAQLYIIDILFMCVASNTYNESVNYLDKTRNTIDFLYGTKPIKK